MSSTTTASLATDLFGSLSVLAKDSRTWVLLSEQYGQVVVPWCEATSKALHLPAWETYRTAWVSCTRDVAVALSSACHLSYLTCRPIAWLLWLLLGKLWTFLLEHGGRSLQKGFYHSKWACIHIYRFQMSLNGTQLLGEAGLLLVCVGLFYLRRWLLRQTYWAKFVKWYTTKKRNLVRSYTDAVLKVARVSKILAMALPHLLFVALGVSLRIALPGAVSWVTHETPTIAILTVYYPFVSTLIWVNINRRQKNTDDEIHNDNEITQQSSSNKNNKTKNESKKTNGTSVAGSKISERKAKFEQASTTIRKGDKKESVPEFVTETMARATTKYWLRYWQLYAIIQASGSCLSMVPIVGRFLVSHPFFTFFAGECKLFFFVWVFGMERLLGGTTTARTRRDNSNNILAEALPLRLVHGFLTPSLQTLHSFVSETIPRETWQKWIVSKTKTTLSIAVMVRAVSEDTKDWLVQLAEEARVLALPSVTLLMPGFVTQFGVAYVRYIVPGAKSSKGCAQTHEQQLIFLKYWILHCGLSGLLARLEGFLWWIPFSTHLVFLLWSYLILPKTIKAWYGILESELLAFGILPRESDSDTGSNDHHNGGSGLQTKIHNTKTAWLVRSLLQRLPSAVADDNNANHNNTKKDDGETSGKGKKTQKSDGEDESSESSVSSDQHHPRLPEEPTPIPIEQE